METPLRTGDRSKKSNLVPNKNKQYYKRNIIICKTFTSTLFDGYKSQLNEAINPSLGPSIIKKEGEKPYSNVGDEENVEGINVNGPMKKNLTHIPYTGNILLDCISP